MTNMNASLLQTALLALQTAGDAKFTMSYGDDAKSGFWWKSYATDDDILLQTIVYMTEASPSGYAVQSSYYFCDANDDEILAVMLDKNLETFIDFQKIFAPDYLEKIYVSHVSEN